LPLEPEERLQARNPGRVYNGKGDEEKAALEGLKEVPKALEPVWKPAAIPAVEAGLCAFAIIFVFIIDSIGRTLPGNGRCGKEIFYILHGTTEFEAAGSFSYLSHDQ